jgi:hypothetical protein
MPEPLLVCGRPLSQSLLQTALALGQGEVRVVFSQVLNRMVPLKRGRDTPPSFLLSGMGRPGGKRPGLQGADGIPCSAAVLGADDDRGEVRTAHNESVPVRVPGSRDARVDVVQEMHRGGGPSP